MTARTSPILFSSEMIRAILDGRKTQTRRRVTNAPADTTQVVPSPLAHSGDLWDFQRNLDNPVAIRCPYGKPGDHLWVRETWNTFDPGTDCPVPIPPERWGKRAPWTGCQGDRPIEWTAVYRADGELEHPADGPACWKPSIFMPRWASRITLEISEGDAKAEGVKPYTPPHGRLSPEQRVPGPGFDRCRLGDQPHRLPFADLWDSINGKRCPWTENPWAWALSFRRLP